jgi:phage-related protein
MNLKKVIWLANTRDKMKDLPVETCQALGKSLLNVQLGIDPVDWKIFTEIGPGTIEIRVHRPHEYRLLYVARFPEAIYVLHVFEKKTQNAKGGRQRHPTCEATLWSTSTRTQRTEKDLKQLSHWRCMKAVAMFFATLGLAIQRLTASLFVGI